MDTNADRVNIWTFDYFEANFCDRKLPAPDTRFNSLNWNTIPLQIIQKIVSDIEYDGKIDPSGVNLAIVGNIINIPSKFTTGINAPVTLDLLSTSCKTALLIARAKELGEKSFIDLSECGPKALKYCLDMLKGSSVTGVLRVPLDFDGEYYDEDGNSLYDICLNGEEGCDWGDVWVAFPDDCEEV